MSNEQAYQQRTLSAAGQPGGSPLCGFGEAGHCLTCADKALPARVLSVKEAAWLALVEMLGTAMEVDITLVEAVRPGDWLLVHGGVAMAHVEEEDDG